MKKAIFFIVDDYADWEGAWLASLLNQREDWEVKTASTQLHVKSIGGFKINIDYLLEKIPEKIDLFVMIGGNSWELENDCLKKTIHDLLESEIIVGAICGAVDYLARNGLLNQYEHTGNALVLWQQYLGYNNHKNFIAQQAVRDRNLVTANGTAACEFTKLVLTAVGAGDEFEIEKAIALHQLGFYKFCEKYGNPFLNQS